VPGSAEVAAVSESASLFGYMVQLDARIATDRPVSSAHTVLIANL
jgi:hypothetical protein